MKCWSPNVSKHEEQSLVRVVEVLCSITSSGESSDMQQLRRWGVKVWWGVDQFGGGAGTDTGRTSVQCLVLRTNIYLWYWYVSIDGGKPNSNQHHARDLQSPTEETLLNTSQCKNMFHAFYRFKLKRPPTLINVPQNLLRLQNFLLKVSQLCCRGCSLTAWPACAVEGFSTTSCMSVE